MYGYNQIIAAADAMQANRQSAISARVRYLKECINVVAGRFADAVVAMLDAPPVDMALYDSRLDNEAKRLDNLRRELQLLRRRMTGRVDSREITGEMVQRARLYPIELLVEFKRGKTQAFCHDDRNPSAFYGTRTNTLQCPVCAKSFDPIAVLMERDGLSFGEAVRQLQ